MSFRWHKPKHFDSLGTSASPRNLARAGDSPPDLGRSASVSPCVFFFFFFFSGVVILLIGGELPRGAQDLIIHLPSRIFFLVWSF